MKNRIVLTNKQYKFNIGDLIIIGGPTKSSSAASWKNRKYINILGTVVKRTTEMFITTTPNILYNYYEIVIDNKKIKFNEAMLLPYVQKKEEKET